MLSLTRLEVDAKHRRTVVEGTMHRQYGQRFGFEGEASGEVEMNLRHR